MTTLKKVFAAPGRGSQYNPHLYRPGDICRWRDKWMVCAGFRHASVPLWDCFDEFGDFIDQIGSVDNEISAPYEWDYTGLPESVLTKATAARLTA